VACHSQYFGPAAFMGSTDKEDLIVFRFQILNFHDVSHADPSAAYGLALDSLFQGTLERI